MQIDNQIMELHPQIGPSRPHNLIACIRLLEISKEASLHSRKFLPVDVFNSALENVAGFRDHAAHSNTLTPLEMIGQRVERIPNVG
ncbi:hypothetical protein AB5I41_31590 [Sphingomonas sp. MMS24-JH45]